MPPDHQSEKQQLRQAIRHRLSALKSSARHQESRAVCEHLGQLDFFLRATKILFFAPLPGEIDIWPLFETTLQKGRLLALPRFNPATKEYEACLIQDPAADLIIGHYELREPAPECPILELNEFDLVIVPGIGFDRKGNRLGRGKGYYDRLLAKTSAFKCGVAFDVQLVEAIPAANHDIQMQAVITAGECVRMNPQ